MAQYFIKDGEEYKAVTLDDLIKSEKLVTEAVFLEVKGSAETRQKQLTDKNAELQTSVDSLLARATTAESAVETVKAELEPLKLEAAKVSPLMQQVTELTTRSSAAEGQLLDTRRTNLIEKYNIQGEKATQVKSMTAEQLTALETSSEIFGLTPGNPPRPQFARTNPGPTDANMSALDTIKAGLSEIPTMAQGSPS